MKISRKQNKGKPTAILSADWHLRADVPVCRTDDYISTMQNKVNFIINLAKEHRIPILIAGDIGHRMHWPNWLLEWTINKFRQVDISVIVGQHDLPNHKLELLEQSGVGVLRASQCINYLNQLYFYSDFCISPFNFGEEIKKLENKFPIKSVCMTHQMVIESQTWFPGQVAAKGVELLINFPEYDLILSGDNHKPFVVKHEGRLLVNPGSMMRNTADQITHKPRVYLWYKDTNEVEAVYLPIQKDVISIDHIVDPKERDSRMGSYIERVRNDVEIELSFEDNIIKHIIKYGIDQAVKNKILKCFPENSNLKV